MKRNTENTRGQSYNYELIRVAILRQAVSDYKAAVRKLEYRQMARLEHFFLSDWGQLLSYDHGEYIIDHCKRIVRMSNESKDASKLDE